MLASCEIGGEVSSSFHDLCLCRREVFEPYHTAASQSALSRIQPVRLIRLIEVGESILVTVMAGFRVSMPQKQVDTQRWMTRRWSVVDTVPQIFGLKPTGFASVVTRQ